MTPVDPTRPGEKRKEKRRPLHTIVRRKKRKTDSFKFPCRKGKKG